MTDAKPDFYLRTIPALSYIFPFTWIKRAEWFQDSSPRVISAREIIFRDNSEGKTVSSFAGRHLFCGNSPRFKGFVQ